MKWAVGVVAILLLLGCQQQASLPASLQALKMVPEGHLCDPDALMQVVAHEYPGIDPGTAQQKVDHLLYVLGCGSSAPTSPEQQAVATPPSTPELVSPFDEIPLEQHGSTYTVPVRINATITLPFVLDTGATDLVIPADVALTLIRAGALTSDDFIGKKTYFMANGSEEMSERVIIREVQVGQHVVNDVTALISPPEGEPLLGQSFLARFGTVTLDYNRLVLILSR